MPVQYDENKRANKKPTAKLSTASKADLLSMEIKNRAAEFRLRGDS